MQDNKPIELTNVVINGVTFKEVAVYGLKRTHDITDHENECGFGESAQVIIGINFDLVIVYFPDNFLIEFTEKHEQWETIKKQVTNHILDDFEFMKEWQERELKND